MNSHRGIATATESADLVKAPVAIVSACVFKSYLPCPMAAAKFEVACVNRAVGIIKASLSVLLENLSKDR